MRPKTSTYPRGKKPYPVHTAYNILHDQSQEDLGEHYSSGYRASYRCDGGGARLSRPEPQHLQARRPPPARFSSKRPALPSQCPSFTILTRGHAVGWTARDGKAEMAG